MRRITYRSLWAIAAAFTLSCGGPLSSSTECDEPEDCAEGEVCLFGLNECHQRCDPGGDSACPLGQSCKECATGSCPACRDCVAACTF
jgi:hypothetical protein